MTGSDYNNIIIDSKESIKMSEKLVLIDGHSILNRAYHALPDLTNSEGLHTNAVYGFLNIMFKILDEEKPDYLTVAFDVHAPTFRHRMFDAYKGTRKPMDEELRQQVPMIKEMLTAMGIKIVEKEGYEADDILGTLSVRAEKAGMDVAIISGDRDLLQLATDHVMVRIPKTKKTGTEIENYNTADVIEKYGVTPKEFIDVKALQGDTSDNIPGVPGIGEKTAGALIAKYHCIEAFSQEDNAARSQYGGTGLGMSIVNQLVQKMNGTITVESTVGEGSCFTVTLPFAIDHDPPAAGPEKEASADLHGKRLLVVEDNELNMEIVEFMLKSAGAEVVKAFDGESAVRAFAADPAGYDAILMDLDRKSVV